MQLLARIPHLRVIHYCRCFVLRLRMQSLPLSLMVDTLSSAARSQRMSLIRSKNTKPELLVRRIAHAIGYRHRLHVAGLPGRPDLVYPRLRKVIFVHGCFWHRHARCKLARLPKSKLDFWLPKLDSNHERDLKTMRKLRAAGWRVLVLWECQTSRVELLEQKIRKFLGSADAKC
jgi:DNA mismatch endonuclease (patch repair protein)